jgi:excisionase family DNA binding protein
MRSRSFFAQFVAALARDTPAYTATVSQPSRALPQELPQSAPASETSRRPGSRAYRVRGENTSSPRQRVEGGAPECKLSEVRFLTVAEAAAAMRVSKMTIYRLVHSGELPAVRNGRSFRVPEQAVHDYLRDAYVDVEGA